MAKKKIYAIKVGRNPGIYQTWEQAKEQVEGFSESVYKSFSTLEEAEAFISENSSSVSINLSNDLNNKIQHQIDNLNNDQVIAFVDGSYAPDVNGKEKCAFGSVIINNGEKTVLYKSFIDQESLKIRNIAGELRASTESILWAIENKKKEITIFYDYEGVEKWATKEWQAKSPITKDYCKFCNEKSNLIKLNFEKVPAHSGIIYNEEADQLAKRALLEQGYKTYKDGSVYFYGLTSEQWVNIIQEVSIANQDIDPDSKILYDIEKDESRDYLTKFNISCQNDKVKINFYNGNKSYVQGKQSVLFQKIISYAITNLPTEGSVIEVLNAYHSLNINKTELDIKFESMLPDFPSNIKDEKHYNCILSAVYNTIFTGYMPEYTCLVTPLFRVFEYYLHDILSNKLGQNTERENGSNNFSFFNKNNETKLYEYNSNKKDFTQEKIDYLNELYNEYNKTRHPYSHWSKNSIDTRVITEIEIVRELLNDGLQLINKYYIIFS